MRAGAPGAGNGRRAARPAARGPGPEGPRETFRPQTAGQDVRDRRTPIIERRTMRHDARRYTRRGALAEAPGGKSTIGLGSGGDHVLDFGETVEIRLRNGAGHGLGDGQALALGGLGQNRRVLELGQRELVGHLTKHL